MHRSKLAGAILAAAVTVVPSAHANAQQFQATFSGFNVVQPLGPIFSTGQGTLLLNLNRQQQSLTYTLTYSNLSAPVTQAHIHFGKVHVAGGVMVFFCAVGGPVGTPLCPAPSATLTGMFTPASVVGPTQQNIAVGNFDALAAALLSETAYADIATTLFPAGEIRGEIIQRKQNQQ
jgi:CHRD domain